MLAPQSTKLYALIATFLILLATVQVAAQTELEISTIEPEFITPCGEPASFSVTIKNDNISPVTDVVFSYRFAEGIQYVPGSIMGLDIVELDLSDLTEPVFSIAAIPGGLSLTYTLEGVSGCDILDNNNQIVNLASAIVQSDTFSVFTAPFNVNVPSISITSSSNYNYQAGVGEQFQRSVTITNSGFGEATELYVIDAHATSALPVLDMSPGTFWPTGNDTTAVLLTATDFMLIGDGDGVFEQGEEIELVQLLEVLGCESVTGTLTIGWGCDGEICDFYQVASQVSVLTEIPELDLVIGENQFAGYCTPGYTEVQLVNIGSPGYTGQATAYNIILEAGWYPIPIGNNGLNQDSCLLLSNFSVGGNNLQVDTSNFGGYGLALDQLSQDPDGPGGLDDLDGDGAYDDLALGDTLTMLIETSFDLACFADNCGLAISSTTLGIESEFTNQCAQPFTGQASDPAIVYQLSQPSVGDNFEITYAGGDIVQIEFLFSRNVKGFDEACQNDSTVYQFVLPPTLNPMPGFTPFENGQPVDFAFSGDTLFLFSPGNAYLDTLEMEFQTVCDSNYLSEPTLPCAVVSPFPIINQIAYQVDYYCNPAACSEPIPLYCGVSNEHFITCEDNLTSPDEGVTVQFMEMERTSYGWTDETLTTKIDPQLTPGVNLQNILPLDTVHFSALGTVFGTNNYDSTRLVLSYYNGQNDPYFELLQDSIRYYDIETNTWFDCVNLVDVIVGAETGSHSIELDLLSLLQPGNCLDGVQITSGDSIYVYMDLRSANSAPGSLNAIPGLKASFIFQYQGNDLGCNDFPETMTFVDPGFKVDVQTEFSGLACDTVVFHANVLQGDNNIGQNDLFPFEYRPYSLFDSIEFQIQQELVYVPGSSFISYEYRDGNTANGPVLEEMVAIPDPEVSMAGANFVLTYNQTPSYPIVDLIKKETKNELTFSMLPQCTTTDPLTYESNFYMSRYYYLLDGAVDQERFLENLINYQISDRQLFVPVVSQEGVTDTVSWLIEVCNGVANPNNPLDIPNNWFGFEVPASAVQLTGMTDISDPNNPVFYPVLPYGMDEGQWVQIGVHEGGGCRLFELEAVFATCESISFPMHFDFQCGGYPSHPDSVLTVCEPTRLEQQLILFPRSAELQTNLVAAPSNPFTLCDPLPYQLKVVNTQIGNAFDINIEIELPSSGLFLVSGSSQIDLGPLGVFPLNDPMPIPNTDLYTWSLNGQNLPIETYGLPGVLEQPQNEFILSFLLETDCEYVDQANFRYSASWRNSCASQNNTPSFFSAPLLVDGAPTEFNDYLLGLETQALLNCGNAPFTLSVVNNGPELSTVFERIRLVVPEGVDFVPSSFQNVYNMTSNPVPMIELDNGLRWIEWEMPAGIVPGDSLVFSIELLNLDAAQLACTDTPMALQILETAQINCATAPGGFCELFFEESSSTFTIPVEAAPLSLEYVDAFSVPFSTVEEQYTFIYQVENISSNLPANGEVVVDFFYDFDENFQFDENIDLFLGAHPIDLNGMPPGAESTYQFELVLQNNWACGGFLGVLSEESNDCICHSDTLYIPFAPLQNAGTNDSICAGTAIEIGTLGIDGYQYSWTPTTYLDDPTSPTPTYQYTGPIVPGELIVDTLYLETTRSSGCVSVDTLLVSNTSLDAGAFVSSDYNGYEVSCPSAQDGTASTQILGGIAPFTYIWSVNSQTTADAVGLPVGMHFVTVTDAYGCAYVDTVNLEGPPSLQIDVQFSDYNGFNVSCANGANGTAEIIPAGGVGGYEFLWFDNTTEALHTDLAAGVYPITVSDANGCQFVTNLTLDQPSPVQISSTSTPAFCHPDSTGSIEVTLSGGVPNYFYEGEEFSNTYVVEDLLSGTWNLEVVDLNDCPVTVTDSVALIMAEFAFPSEDASCPFGPDGSICVDIVVPTAGPYSYSWQNGETDSCIVNYPAGLYPVTVTDGLGCQYPLNPIIGSPTDMDIQADPTPVTCHAGNDGAISITASGGTPPYNYIWSNGGMGTTQTNLVGGTYVLTLTDAQGCVYTELIEVPEPDPFTVDFTTEDVNCNGGNDGSATILASNGNEPFTYLWEDGTIGDEVVNLTLGYVSVFIQDAIGCVQQDSVFIAQPPVLELQATSTPAQCDSMAFGTVTLMPLGGTEPYSLDGNTFSAPLVIEDLLFGNYQYEVVDANGCTVEMPVEVPLEISTFSFTTQAIECNGTAAGQICVVPENGFPPYSYQWSNGLTSDCLDNLPAGTYQVTITDANGCVYIHEILMEEPTPIDASLEIIEPSCAGDQNGLATVSVSGGTPPYSYQWNLAGNGATQSNLGPGLISVTVTDANGCTWQEEGMVEDPLPIQVSSEVVDVTCPAGKDGSISLAIQNAVGIPEVSWSGGQSGSILAGIPAGTYVANIVDANGCTASLEVQVQEPLAPAIDFLVEDISCYGLRDGSVMILSPVTEGYSYSLDGENFTEVTEFPNLEEGAYSLFIKDAADCLFVESFGIQDAPEALVTTSPDTIIQLGQTVEVEAFPYPTVTSLNWVLDPTLSCSECLVAEANPLESTTYTVQVATADGCLDEESVTVLVKKEDDLYIPNGFSPNADGVNDKFLIYAGQSVTQVDFLRVFNRWGGLLFEQTDFQPNDPTYGWDGWFNNQPVGTDVYVYLVQVTYIDGRQEVFKGSITLMR